MRKKFIDFTDDIVGKYLKEVNKHNRKHKLLTSSEEVELAIRIQNGDKKAVDEMILANLNFVVSVAKEYQGNGVPLSDLINNGNEGLIKAVHKFDHTRGFKLISFAVWWIRQGIIQGLNDNSRAIRLPVNVINKLGKINKKINEFEVEMGREPNIGENIGDINDPVIYEGINYPQIVSTNLVINEDGDELGSILPIEDTSDDIILNEDAIKLELNNILSELQPRERDIIELYFGLVPELEPMTLEGIGEQLGLTKERVRQIKEKAIRRLRYHAFDLYSLING